MHLYFQQIIAENAGNRISEVLDFKIFRGGDYPGPPYFFPVLKRASVTKSARSAPASQQRLLLLDLIPLCSWHEFLDVVLLYKLIHGHVSIGSNLLPSTTNNNRRET